MAGSPYRVPSKNPSQEARSDPHPDRDLYAVLVLAWTLSLAWVILQVRRGCAFDTGDSLAFLVVLLLPLLLRRPSP